MPCSPARSVRVGSEGRWAVSPAARPASPGPSPRPSPLPVPPQTEFEVSVPVHLGRLLLAKLRKILLDDAWFCERISARPGTQGEARFPCYRRVRGDQVVCLPEGTGEGVGGGTRGWGRHDAGEGTGRRAGPARTRVQGGLCSCPVPQPGP